MADFTDADPSAAAYKYTSSIDWGDGTSASSGTIVDNGNGDFSVTGGHTYTTVGTFNLTVTINDAGGASAVADGQADVALPPPQTPGGLVATDVSNQEIDLSWSPDPSGYSAGYNVYASTNSGFTPGTDNLIDFGVTGTTYQDTGLSSNTTFYYYVTSVNAASTESAPSNEASATTAAAVILSNTVNFTATEGQQYDGVVASFTDNDINADAGNYTATINWGDNTTNTPGTIQVNSTGGFDIVGTHGYSDAVTLHGHANVSAFITVNDGRTASAYGSATIADAPIQAEGTTIYGNESVGFLQIATITDNNSNATTSDFPFGSNLIKWGDGQTSRPTIQQSGSGTFAVMGNHQYSSPGNYTIEVDIVDAAGSTAVAYTTAVESAPVPGGAIVQNANPVRPGGRLPE